VTNDDNRYQTAWVRLESYYPNNACMKYWELIADRLGATGWSLGWVSAIDSEGRTIWIVDAHGYGKRFVVRAEEILTAFLELEKAIHQFAVDLIS
jgi:hypothetical protein